MEFQANKICEELETIGWQFLEKVKPQDFDQRTIWEYWTFKKGKRKIWLAYIIDPMSEGPPKSSHVWSVNVYLYEPKTETIGSNIASLSLGRKWEKGIQEFLDKITTVITT